MLVCPQAWQREVASPSQVNALALSTACHSLTLDLRWSQQGKRCSMCYIWAEPQMPTQAEHWTSVSIPTILQQCPPLVQRSQCGEKAKHKVEGNGASLSQTFRYSIPATWEKTPRPDRAVMATEQRASPASYPYQTLAPLSAAEPPTKVIACQHPLRKDMTGTHIKGVEHMLFTQVHSHIRTPLQDQNR